MAREVEVLIVAGGDGSFSDAINALDSRTTFSYLPFGSGCALRYALDLPPQLTRIAKRIKEGRLRLYDLILCDGVRKGFMTEHRARGRHPPPPGVPAGKRHPRGPRLTPSPRSAHSSRISNGPTCPSSIDGEELPVPNAVTAIVTKIPYYGYKMKMVPNAVFDDGHLHLLAINSGWAEIVGGMANAFLKENPHGHLPQGPQDPHHDAAGTVRPGRRQHLPQRHQLRVQGPAAGPADLVLTDHGIVFPTPDQNPRIYLRSPS